MRRHARALGHQISRVFVCEAFDEVAQLGPVGGIEVLVTVEPENPIPGGVPNALVVRSGEVVDPLEFMDLGIQLSGDLAGVVVRAGVDDDDLVSKAGGRAKAPRKGGCLVSGDHAKRHPHGHCASSSDS